ncbi:MAG: metallophosphoesterase [Oscillospiraceae bacterium]|nr:metallophosphoesterase [Oscillospiraceae bacterium]
MKEKDKKKMSSKKKKLLMGAAAAIAVIFGAGFIGDNCLTVSKYELTSDKVSEKIRIVNVSDLHNKRFGKEQSRLTETVLSLEPDIIVMTGDIAEHPSLAKNAYTFIKNVSDTAPVYYSPGNHEHRLSSENFNRLMDGITEAGGTVLTDEYAVEQVKGNHINIIGLDDISLNNETLKELCAQVDHDNYTAVLAHEPQYIENYQAQDCELVMSGHAHGGQIILPFIGPVFAPDQLFFPKYTEGVHTANGTSLVISRGLANNAPCPRFFNPPEIVVIDIE